VDEEILNDFINAFKLDTLNGKISCCLGNEGFKYEIPEYCIHEPYEYKIIPAPKVKGNPYRVKTISLYIRRGKDQVIVLCKNTWTVLELKNSITNIGKTRITEFDKLRLFFGGKELQNIQELWSYNIDDDHVIQLLYIYN
jgi:hypothetical protein